MEVAIIGSGVAGLILALTLHQNNVKSTIYELRSSSDTANPGAIALAPNALRIFDKLGLHDQLTSAAWAFNYFQTRNENDEVIQTINVGTRERYGYDNLRIVRRRLHDILFAAAQKAGVTIVTGKKFSRVIDETDEKITFAFADDTTATCTVLVGADGIHSSVRRTLYPDIEPEYKGSLTLTAHLSKNPLLNLPQTPDLQTRLRSTSITLGRNGAFLFLAQSHDGQEIAFGLDRPYPGQTREKWDALLRDKTKQYELLMEDAESWPETIQILLRATTPEDMYRSWPFFALPELPRWSSEDRRVVVVGDAAHAIPPSGGQGACMAVEDAWSLGIVLGMCVRDGVAVGSDGFRRRVGDWEAERVQRVGKVREMTAMMGKNRLPGQVKREVGAIEEVDLGWLLDYHFEGGKGVLNGT